MTVTEIIEVLVVINNYHWKLQNVVFLKVGFFLVDVKHAL